MLCPFSMPIYYRVYLWMTEALVSDAWLSEKKHIVNLISDKSCLEARVSTHMVWRVWCNVLRRCPGWDANITQFVTIYEFIVLKKEKKIIFPFINNSFFVSGAILPFDCVGQFTTFKLCIQWRKTKHFGYNLNTVYCRVFFIVFGSILKIQWTFTAKKNPLRPQYCFNLTCSIIYKHVRKGGTSCRV